MTELLSGLIGALLGSVIGGAAVLWAARAQRKHDRDLAARAVLEDNDRDRRQQTMRAVAELSAAAYVTLFVTQMAADPSAQAIPSEIVVIMSQALRDALTARATLRIVSPGEVSAAADSITELLGTCGELMSGSRNPTPAQKQELHTRVEHLHDLAEWSSATSVTGIGRTIEPAEPGEV